MHRLENSQKCGSHKRFHKIYHKQYLQRQARGICYVEKTPQPQLFLVLVESSLL